MSVTVALGRYHKAKSSTNGGLPGMTGHFLNHSAWRNGHMSKILWGDGSKWLWKRKMELCFTGEVLGSKPAQDAS